MKGALVDDRGGNPCRVQPTSSPGVKANLEGANLKEALLEDCNISGANLR